MLDSVEIYVHAGDGGAGAISLRHEKAVSKGGPDGGDGGRGGHVFLLADPGFNTLGVFQHKRQCEASAGGPGLGRDMHGKNGKDLTINVPVGTVVYRVQPEGELEMLADLAQPGQAVLLARGGDGGRGNAHFSTTRDHVPRIAEAGERGESGTYVLELKLLADVGIIGFPNVGKSSLLAAASAARPKIANYPFTTLEPNLGVANVGWRTLVMADIPGLIEGAHEGKGLGHDFLRHIERTRLLVHIIDGESPHPARDVAAVNREMALFNKELGERRQLVVVNKIDLPHVRERIPRLRGWLRRYQPLFFVSAATHDGVSELITAAARYLDSLPKAPPAALLVRRQTLIPPRTREVPEVVQQDGAFIVRHSRAERLAARSDTHHPQVLGQLWEQFRRMGVVKALERAGATPGAAVRLGEVTLRWWL